MIKIRIIRNIYDTTHSPASFTQNIEWIGCIPSQISDLFPLTVDQSQDRLADHERDDGTVRTSTRFEAFANGTWYRISDPRMYTAPASEEDLLDMLFKKGCPQCYTIGPADISAGQICTQCQQENAAHAIVDYEIACFHCNTAFDISDLSNDGYCEVCENLVECTECPYRFEASKLTNGKCKNCHATSQHYVKIDELLELDD